MLRPTIHSDIASTNSLSASGALARVAQNFRQVAVLSGNLLGRFRVQRTSGEAERGFDHFSHLVADIALRTRPGNLGDVAVLLAHDAGGLIGPADVFDDLPEVPQPVSLDLFFVHIGLRMPISACVTTRT